VCESRGLERKFGPRGEEEVAGGCRGQLKIVKKDEMAAEWNAREIWQTHAKVWSENPKRLCGRPKRRWEDNIRIDLREIGGKVWTGFIWLRIGTSGVVL
jgi:hypothetical protein